MSFSLYIAYDHKPAEHKLSFDKLLSSVLPLLWYQKRYWTPRQWCQENLLHVEDGKEWMGTEGEKGKRK